MYRWLFLIFVCWTAACQAAEPLHLRYPPGQSAADKRYQYYWDLLGAALKANEAQYGSFDLQAVEGSMNPPRAALEVASKGLVNIIVRTASPELETQLLPIRIPLDKGLTGYRLFLIKAEQQRQLDRVRDLADLSQFTIGQDKNWIDVRILRGSGLSVVEGEGYAGLFRMLDAGRFDMFSRGVNEIADEFAAQQPQMPKLAIERKLALYYPLPRYFFVARNAEGERMAARIEDGLHKLIQNGEFERRYRDYKQLVLKGLPLAGRTVFRIANPTLSAETPLGMSNLWDDLGPELRGSKVRQPR